MHSEPPPLAPYYYRDNFLQLCDTVQAQYADLLPASAVNFLTVFRQLPLAAQGLYIRLVSRVGPVFRESRLAYEELGPAGPLLDELVTADMMGEIDGMTAADCNSLFTRDELRRVFQPLLPELVGGSKALLQTGIEKLGLSPQDCCARLHLIDPLRFIQPAHVDTVGILQLLFFGNRHQGLTDFVLSDLGVTRYYPYALERRHRLFTDRSALDEYLACAALADGWYELVEDAPAEERLAHAARMLVQPVHYRSSERLWYRLCNTVARDMERRGENDTALALYSRSRRHPARARRLRILERSQQWQAAAGECAAILAQPWTEAEREAALRIRARIQRKTGGLPAPRHKDVFAQLQLTLVRDEVADGRPVEACVAAHLADSWAAVHYVENSLMNSLFGLAFWEQIFAPVPGAFHHPYQSVPDDMYDESFVERRALLLAERFQQLASADLPALLRAAYARYYPMQCRWVDWRHVSADLVASTVAVVPAAHLLAIWRHLLFDRRENRRGFPDLIALGEEPGEYCFIEVKAPGDALQDGQKRWLRYFDQHGIPAKVAWVSWRDN